MSIGLFFPRNVLSRNKVELHTSHHQLMDKLHEGWMIRGMFVDDFHHRCSICEEQDAPVTQLMTPHATARTIGRSSFTEMCVSCQVVGKCSWIHASLKSVPNTKPLARWRTSDDDQFTGMNDIVPMKTESNSSQAAKSLRASHVWRTLRCGADMPSETVQAPQESPSGRYDSTSEIKVAGDRLKGPEDKFSSSETLPGGAKPEAAICHGATSKSGYRCPLKCHEALPRSRPC